MQLSFPKYLKGERRPFAFAAIGIDAVHSPVISYKPKDES